MIGPGQYGRSRWLEAALESPVIGFPALRDELQTGDLWFSTGQRCNAGLFLIRLGTRSHWGHVGMVLRYPHGLYLIDAPASGLRRILLEAALLEEIAGECDDPAAIVIARPLVFVGADHPLALSERIVDRIRKRILARVKRGFPSEYDWVEIARIVLILMLGGLARRWRHRPLLGALAGWLPASHLRHLPGKGYGALPGAQVPPANLLQRMLRLSPAAIAMRRAKDEPYTCAELVAELLGRHDAYARKLSLEPGTDDFLSPAVIAERIPLVILGRLQ